MKISSDDRALLNRIIELEDAHPTADPELTLVEADIQNKHLPGAWSELLAGVNLNSHRYKWEPAGEGRHTQTRRARETQADRDKRKTMLPSLSRLGALGLVMFAGLSGPNRGERWLPELQLLADKLYIGIDELEALGFLVRTTGRGREVAMPTSAPAPRGRRHSPDAGNKIKADARKRLVWDYIREKHFVGTLRQLQGALAENGLAISQSTLSRYGARKWVWGIEGTGTPHRTARGRSEREPVTTDDPAQLAEQREELGPGLDAYTMPDDIA